MLDLGEVEGRFLGIPVRFDAQRAFENFWNPMDARVFPPTNLGFGWDVNFHAVLVNLGLTRRR